MLNIMKNKIGDEVPFFEFLVWLNLGWNPGLPDKYFVTNVFTVYY